MQCAKVRHIAILRCGGGGEAHYSGGKTWRGTRLVLDFHIGTPTFTQGKQVLHGHHHTPIMTLELPVSLTLAIWLCTVGIFNNFQIFSDISILKDKCVSFEYDLSVT